MKKILIGLSLAMLLATTAHAARSKIKKIKAVPEFSAKSFLVADAEGLIIKEQEGSIVRPIASISKLMVGLLASEQDLSETLHIPSTRAVHSSIPRKVHTLTRKELLTLALVKSDNLAALILCENIHNCVEEMNARAKFLDMTRTHFNEPTGLDSGNVSTAQDLLKFMLAVSSNEIVSELSRMPDAEVADGFIRVKNTNPLTSKFSISLSKTGFTNPAGGCLVMMMESSKRIYILLGSRNSRTRIPDMERLMKGLD